MVKLPRPIRMTLVDSIAYTDMNGTCDPKTSFIGRPLGRVDPAFIVKYEVVNTYPPSGRNSSFALQSFVSCLERSSRVSILTFSPVFTK